MNTLLELRNFYNSFAGKKGVIGYSEFNRPIYFFGVSKTPKPVIICQYAIHAREYITTHLAMLQITHFLTRGERGSVYFIPAVNPDGIVISQTASPLWKANGRGVDLNVNFPARWGLGAQNTRIEGGQNYIGKYPLSERESRALADFTLAVKPDITLSYHAKGEEVYWEFFQQGSARERDCKIAETVSKSTGYPLVQTAGSCGGYKDWCIQSLAIPALTIEVGQDGLFHPIGKDSLLDIFEKNKLTLLALTRAYGEDKWT